MYVQVKSSNGISLIPIETKLMGSRRIFIDGDIDEKMACEFTKKVIYLNEEDRTKAIDVFINSRGGEINSGMLIYDVIQSSIAPIRIFCIGKAYSMAAILFASGNHGRYILPNGEVMIHEPLLGSQVSGSSSSIKSISDSLLETKDKMNKILAKHTGQKLSDVEKNTGYDHYLTSDEAVKFGIADEVINFDMILGGNEL